MMGDSTKYPLEYSRVNTKGHNTEESWGTGADAMPVSTLDTGPQW